MTHPATNQLTDQPDIDELAFALELAKAGEERARNARIAAELALLDAIGAPENEGTHTEITDFYKISIKQAINRTIDKDALEQVQANAPDAVVRSVFRYKPELNLSAYRELQKLDPATFAIVAICVTEKPSKPSVSIERITH